MLVSPSQLAEGKRPRHACLRFQSIESGEARLEASTGRASNKQPPDTPATARGQSLAEGTPSWHRSSEG